MSTLHDPDPEFEGRVSALLLDVFIRAGDETGDEDALERGDIQLGRDRCFDRYFEIVRTPGECAHERQGETTDRLSSRGH